MSLLRRNKSSDQAAPQASVAPAESAPKETKKAREPFNLRQWIIDSYNGLYKVVIAPSMPTIATVVAVLVGLFFGMVWAYSVNPTVFTGANPERLNQGAQDQWIRMVAGSYSRGFYDEAQAADLLGRVENPGGAVARMLLDPNIAPADQQALAQVQALATQVAGTPTPQAPNLIATVIQWLIPFVLFTILIPVVVVVYRLLIQPNFVAPAIQKYQEMRDPELRAKNQAAREALGRMREQRAEAERLKAETVTDVELGDPVMQVLKVYSKGRAYDESDEIEDNEDFLGQSGSVIPESVDPDPVAVEVWLFDMFSQSRQNHKKLFVTQFAYDDASLRSRLLSDSELTPADLIVAAPGAKLTIDSEKIRLQAELVGAETDERGRFSSFRMKVTAWRKTGNKAAPVPPMAAAPAPLPAAPLGYDPLPPAPAPQAAVRPLTPPPAPVSSGLPPMSAYDNLQFDPPPVPPASYMPPPPAYVPPSQPLPPPPMPSDDDDPFGGTADFTPIPRP